MRLAPEVGITEAERFRLRNEAIAAMALPDLRVAKELDVPRAKENGFAVDPAFERYAFKRDDGTVVVRRLADDAELFRLPGLPPARGHTQAGFSPDGRYLAMTSGGRDILQVWDLQERRLVLTDREMAWSNAVNWSFRPDGRELALGRTDGSIVFYELPSGRLLRRWTEYPSAWEPWPTARTARGSRSGPRTGARSRSSPARRARLLATLPHPADCQPLRLEPAPAEPAGRGLRGQRDLHLGRGHRQADHGPQGRDLQRDHPRLSPRRRAAGQPRLAQRAAALGHPDGPAGPEPAVVLVLDARVRPDRPLAERGRHAGEGPHPGGRRRGRVPHAGRRAVPGGRPSRCAGHRPDGPPARDDRVRA